MKTAIVFYSYSGNTNRVAHLMVNMLNDKNQTAIPVRIRPVKEETNFFKQCIQAARSRKPELYRTLTDLTEFDRIIFGSPVWAFKPAPALNTYFAKCGNLSGKKAICFVTYGSGTGKDKALDVMKKELEKRGASVTDMVSFQQAESDSSCREKLEKIL